MPSCRDIEPLITPFVDEEATAAERSVVAEHLAACGRCRNVAAREQAGRRILRERAEGFRVEAPATLRARCVPPPAPAPRRFFLPLVRPLPIWATAVLVLAILAGGFYAAGRGTTVFAAELALDHVKCFALFGNASSPIDPSALSDRMKTSYGWSITVPAASSALGLRLVGGRRCVSTDGRVAHILYRHAGRPLSLFVVPSATRDARQLAVIGHEAIIWSARGKTYVVVAREPMPEVERVVAYLKAAVEQP